MRIITKLRMLSYIIMISSCALAHAGQKAPPKKVAPPVQATPAAALAALAPPPAKGGTARGPASLDSDRAVEIRGQSRTLSMMLVLKNGKENINFIKERHDYSPEIKETPF